MESRERFERLYRDHAGLVRRFARRRGDDAEADDVVADVFVSAWRRLDEVPADPVPWLLSVARGVLSNRRRAEDRHSELIARLMHEQSAGAASGECELDLEMVRALGSLKASDQELLLLVAWERLSGEQIAKLLKLHRGTVAVRLHRARRRLRVALANQQQPDRRAPDSSPEMEVL